MATARTAWGIDIGNRALKAVKVAREADGVRIVDFEVIDHENVLSSAGDNRDALIQSALLHFVQSHNVKGAQVAVGVSGQSSFARFIKLPPVEARKIPEIVRFEAIQQIPFPLDEVEWSYQLFKDETTPDVDVGIFAMRKELVEQQIRFFSDAGLNVQIVQMNPLAVYNAMYHDQRLKGTTMIIDLGAEHTDLIIAEGETVWLRSIPIGGNSFTEALTKSFKLRFEKAEDLKRNAATSKYGRQILQAMRPIFADLVAEIQRSIGFYASVHRDSRITRVVALGGTFRLPGLQKYLQQNLQLEVQKLDRLGNAPPGDAKVATALNENILSSVSAYGLALQGVGEAKIASSLLPQAIQREREWRAKTKWFAAAAACVVAGTALAAGRYYYEQGQYQNAEVVKAQNHIDEQVRLATGLQARWAQLESAGAAEKTQITNVEAMASYRETWENIHGDIMTSVPPAPAVAADPKARTPRDKRQQVLIDEIDPLYLEDLSPALGQDENGILPYLTTQDQGQAARGMAGRPAPPMGRSGSIFVPSAAPAAATPGAAAGAAAGPRGFLVRIHCMTPFQDGQGLVRQTLVQGLRAKSAEPIPVPDAADSAAKPPRSTYRIDKVWVARYVKLSDDPTRVEQLRARAREAAEKRRTAQQGVNGPGFSPTLRPGGSFAPPRGRPGYPAPSQFTRPGTGLPPRAGGPPGGTAAGAPPVEDLVDPQTGESILNDWDVFVVAAVVLDPRPPEAAAAPGAAPAGPSPGRGAPVPAPSGVMPGQAPVPGVRPPPADAPRGRPRP